MGEYYNSIVRIQCLIPHPNADTLDIATVLNGYQTLVKRGEFSEGDLACYFSVDTMVPVAHPAFSFLASRSKGKEYHRVRAMQLRGVFSLGLLIPKSYLTCACVEGVDISGVFGTHKYESPSEELEKVVKHNQTRKAKSVETAKFDGWTMFAAGWLVFLAWMIMQNWWALVPSLLVLCLARLLIVWNRHNLRLPNIPLYDIEGFRKHKHVLKPGEEVVITEKIHGMNASFVHTGRKFHSKSRTMFRPKEETDRWWRIAKEYNLEEKLKKYPNVVLFGEVFGKGVQDLDYGQDSIAFVAFDVMDLKTRQFMNHCDFVQFCQNLGIPRVPILYRGPWDDLHIELAEGKTTLMAPHEAHVREGIVIRPIEERQEHGLGRCLLKLPGEGYLTRKVQE